MDISSLNFVMFCLNYKIEIKSIIFISEFSNMAMRMVEEVWVMRIISVFWIIRLISAVIKKVRVSD